MGTPWVAWHEVCIRTKGTPISAHLIDWARDQGIQSPDLTHVTRTHPIPLPAPVFLRHWLDNRGFPCIHLSGLSLRHGIYLAPNLPDEDDTLRHELIHTRQYQQAGSIFAFLRRYLFQCLTEGYLHCQMEREARGEFPPSSES